MSTAPNAERGDAPRQLRGRGGLLVPLVVAIVCTLVVIGMVGMEVPPETTFPGPRFFPTILVVAGYALSILLVVHYLRHPDEEATETQYRTYSDWPAFAWVAGSFLAFAVLLDVLGWILAAGLLFWGVARGVGSKRPLFDVSVALLLSSLIYLVFAAGLGVTLPSGLLGGM
ncbi:tripartite tricarboxylate transporter TctB family protein [Prauserella alba]|uniref:Tripartite tricarboxylate transporter TctB n=1 Tax=Prauserella alba TaxID=176898 RepID=A0ABP4G723_9PSEU|nr:tripartite tricarboxylate transporter TctB family protein [Prauserella alba]MCP2181964.1 putative tricarboxylic transport membrane protein [Prauserella alba]